MAKPVRRLLIRPGAIGDCLLSFPALHALCIGSTEIWISTPLVPLIDFADAVHSISSTGLDLVGVGDLPIDRLLSQRLQSFDEIISWYGTNRPDFRSALHQLGIPCRFKKALPPPCDIHATDFFLSQAGARPGALPCLRIPHSASLRGSVVLHPFSGSKHKNWPLNYFRELAGRLGAHVEWIAGPEEELPEAVRFPNLQQLAHWLTGASLYIGNDSGITHLAAALGIRTIALFGTTNPRQWAPRGNHVTVIQHQPLTELKVETVLAVL